MNQTTYKVIGFKASELPKQYEAMIYSKFLRSLKHGNTYFKMIDSEPYFYVYKGYLKSLIARPEAMIMLAVLTDDPDVVLGWSLIEPRKAHYVWVHHDNRRIGIAKELLPEQIDTITHITDMILPFLSVKLPNVNFNPFA